MNAPTFSPPIVQIALSVIDLRRSESWYVDGLGLLPAGGNYSVQLMNSPLAAWVQGVPGARSCAWWLVGRNPFFQFELFQFRSPLAKLMPADFRACDLGYTRIGVQVADFERTLANLARLGSLPLTPALGERGRRRVCLRDPDGVFVEVMEDDPLLQSTAGDRTGCGAAARSVTLSTPDLDASVAFFTATIGKGPEAIALHAPEHEALWGLEGARCRRAVFCCGEVLLELVQYLEPVGRSRPAGYRICDQGILNIAFGMRRAQEHRQVFAGAIAAGARANCRPIYIEGGGVVYVNDPLGYSVEMVAMPAGAKERKFGFVPLPREARPLPDNRQVASSVRIAAPLDTVWAVLLDQDRMSEWIGFREVTVTREGRGDRHGVGAERRMRGPTGVLHEQIVGIQPKRSIRYRVIEGAPFHFHRGEITLRRVGDQTEVHWLIGFRGKLPFVGVLLRVYLQRMLERMLEQGLKPFAEQAAGSTAT